MPCFLAIIALFAPRVLMLFIWILTDWFNKAFDTAIWPFLGFIFLPYTTLAYLTTMLNNNHRLDGWWIALLILGVIFDFSSMSSSRKNDD